MTSAGPAPLLPAAVSHERGQPYAGHVCIIGGGVAGVVTARVLLAEGVQCTLLEKSHTLGGVWADNYTGFGIQVPSRLYEFPDKPLPAGWDFAAGERIHGYIQEYAREHDVYEAARFGCDVKCISRDAEQWKVEVESESAGHEVLAFDFVVIATGVYSSTDKFIPQYTGAECRAPGTYLHSVDLKDPSLCKDKHVITVGYGKSAFDCAQIASKLASSSTLLFREVHWPIPRKILGLVDFEWATFSRFGAGCLKPTYPHCGPIEGLVHSIPGLLEGFWWLVAKIFSWQFGLKACTVDLEPKQGFLADYWGGHGCIPHPSFFPQVQSGAIGVKQNSIRTVKPKSVVLESGEELPADVVIFGTGFRPSLSFLPEEVRALRENDGLWLYRQMVHPDQPALCWLNSNTTTFTNITTAAIQARWLAEMLRHGLPSAEEMRSTIEEQKAWKRETMPNAGHARAYMIQTHQVHYYDDLLRDMGVSVRRKQGPLRALRELFEPYRPRDYASVVAGEYKTRKGDLCPARAAQRSFCGELLLCIGMLAIICAACSFMSAHAPLPSWR